MKQVFQNSHITLYLTANKDKMTSNLVFSISNNTAQAISNLKLQFSVPKYFERVINPPSSNSMVPMASFGIKQVYISLNLENSTYK